MDAHKHTRKQGWIIWTAVSAVALGIIVPLVGGAANLVLPVPALA